MIHAQGLRTHILGGEGCEMTNFIFKGTCGKSQKMEHLKTLQEFERALFKDSKLSSFERDMCFDFLRLSAPELIGIENWEEYGPAICEEMQWDMPMSNVFFTVGPRKAGKTHAILWYMATRAQFMCRKGETYCLDVQTYLCPSRRRARLAKEILLKFITQRGLIVIDNPEQLVLENGLSLAKIQFLAPPRAVLGTSDKHTPRGFTTNIVMIDDGELLDQDVFVKYILPFMKLPHVSCFGLSSPPTSNSHWFSIVAQHEELEGGVLVCKECANATLIPCSHVPISLDDPIDNEIAEELSHLGLKP